MKRSDSLEVKAYCKIALSRDVAEELLEWSRLGARLCQGCTRCRPGQGRHSERCPVPSSPLILALLRRRTFPLQHRQKFWKCICRSLEQYSGVYRSGFLAASSPQPLLQPWRTWGAKETQSLHISISVLQGKGRKAQAANPSLQRGADREGAGCRQGEQELERSPKKHPNV